LLFEQDSLVGIVTN